MRALATALSDRIDRGDARVAVGTEILADLGGAEDTVIVFSTDHGLVLGEHGLGGKGFLYELAVNVSLIVYDPRTPDSCRGQHRNELVAVPDLAPTVLDLATSIRPRRCRDGVSVH
jgi:arylsulfatase A-like enzyme